MSQDKGLDVVTTQKQTVTSLTSSKRKLSSSLPDLHTAKKFKREKFLIKLRRSSETGFHDSLIEYEINQLFEVDGMSLNNSELVCSNKDDERNERNKAIVNNYYDALNRIKGLSLVVE